MTAGLAESEWFRPLQLVRMGPVLSDAVRFSFVAPPATETVIVPVQVEMYGGVALTLPRDRLPTCAQTPPWLCESAIVLGPGGSGVPKSTSAVTLTVQSLSS